MDWTYPSQRNFICFCHMKSNRMQYNGALTYVTWIKYHAKQRVDEREKERESRRTNLGINISVSMVLLFHNTRYHTAREYNAYKQIERENAWQTHELNRMVGRVRLTFHTHKHTTSIMPQRDRMRTTQTNMLMTQEPYRIRSSLCMREHVKLF